MKQVRETLEVPSCTAEEFFAVVYCDRTFLRQFHSDVNRDDRCSVPAWEGPNRTVTFRTPINAPALLTRLINADAVAVVECQSVRRLADGSIEVESRPMPQIAGAGRFSTSATLLLCTTDRGCCTVSATVSCTATGPYGLAGTIEAFMTDAAQRGLQEFLSYCKAHIAQLQASARFKVAVAAANIANAGHMAPVAPSIAAPPVAVVQEEAATEVGETEEDAQDAQFYDSMEFRPEAVLEPGTATVDTLALFLQHVSLAADRQTALLASVDARLARLEEPPLAPPSQGLASPAWAAPTLREALFAAGGCLTGGLAVALWCRTSRRR